MSKVKVNYEQLTTFDAEAFLEFDAQVFRKIRDEEQRRRQEPNKKRKRRGRR